MIALLALESVPAVVVNKEFPMPTTFLHTGSILWTGWFRVFFAENPRRMLITAGDKVDTVVRELIIPIVNYKAIRVDFLHFNRVFNLMPTADICRSY